MPSPVQLPPLVFPPSNKVRVNRSASHTGVPARFIAETGGGMKVVGLPSGPRLGRSFSQGDINGFNVQAIGMHYTPSALVIPAKTKPRGLSVSPVMVKRDRKSSLSPPKRRTSLRHLISVDTRIALQAQRAEIAMEVAEEVVMLCDAGEPISTDAPLSVVVKSARQAVQVESWLQARFDFSKTATDLMSDAITPESLASEILAMSAVVSPKNLWATGEIPIMFSGFDLVVSPEDMDFNSLDVVSEDSYDSQEPTSDGELYHVETSPVQRSVTPVESPSILISPPSTPAEIKPLNISKDKKPGRSMALDGKLSKKTGIAVGLLAVGALLGSPSHASFDQFDLALPETPSPYTSHFAIPNSTENIFDRVIDWQGTLPKGPFTGDGDNRISPWADGTYGMI